VRAVRSLGLLQIDSVNVVARAHEFTLFSRLVPYDRSLLERALEERRLFEYWARMASFCPIEDFPRYRYRMDRLAAGNDSRVQKLNESAPGYIEAVYRQVVERGPLKPADLDEPGERSGPWWGWADGKIALEHLFNSGRVTVAHRRNFTRFYDIVERVIPDEYRTAPAIPREEAQELMVLEAAGALALGSERDLVHYFWMGMPEGRQALSRLVARGELVEVEVEGWSASTYMHPAAVVPRSVAGRTLVNPFNTFMWNRDRIERFHDFSYRIEIYVPEPKRVYGYYVFPFLLGEDLVARVDLKADRKAGVLRVPGVFGEDGHDRRRVTSELAIELAELARWLGLDDIAVGDRGDLAENLRRAV
jgi:uncharacterized protein YcaQ